MKADVQMWISTMSGNYRPKIVLGLGCGCHFSIIVVKLNFTPIYLQNCNNLGVWVVVGGCFSSVDWVEVVKISFGSSLLRKVSNLLYSLELINGMINFILIIPISFELKLYIRAYTKLLYYQIFLYFYRSLVLWSNSYSTIWSFEIANALFLL